MASRKRKFDDPGNAPDDTVALADRVQLAEGLPIKNTQEEGDEK